MQAKYSLVALCAALLLVCAAALADASTGPSDSGAETAPAQSARPAADRLELDITSIRGNQELPRIMVIVPWKDPEMGSLVGKPVNSLIDEVLTPVDRDVFRRQTKYFDQLYAPPGTEGIE